MICHRCSRTIPTASDFCAYCGAPATIRSAATDSEPQAPRIGPTANLQNRTRRTTRTSLVLIAVFLVAVVFMMELAGSGIAPSERETGKRDWAAPTAWSPVWTTGLDKPVLSFDTDGMFLVTDGLFGVVHALELESGRVVWTYSADPYPGATSGSYDAVVIDDDVVFVGGPRQTVYAIRLHDGQPVWECSLERYPHVISTLSISVADDVLLVGSASGFAAALDKVSGELLWEFDTTGQVTSAPAVYDGLALVGAWQIYALDIQTGGLVWSYDPSGYIPVEIALNGDTLFVASADETAYALDAGGGELLWCVDLDGQASCPPVIGVDSIFLGGYRTIIAVNSETGQLLWSYDCDDSAGQLVLVGNELLVLGGPNAQNNIYVLDAHTGKALRRLSNPRAWFALVMDEKCLVGTANSIHLLKNTRVAG